MSEFGHNPLCEQARKIDPDVPNCICDWVDAAERDTAERIIKLLEEMFDEWADIRLETLIALIKGENK